MIIYICSKYAKKSIPYVQTYKKNYAPYLKPHNVSNYDFVVVVAPQEAVYNSVF
jgi:hypothetical protein